MLGRDESGRLGLDSFGFELFVDDLFDKCKNVEELEWLEERMMEIIEYREDIFEEELEVEECS